MQVVWEKLCAADGNTQMCGPDFKPYRATHTEHAARVDMGVLRSLPPHALEGGLSLVLVRVREGGGAGGTVMGGWRWGWRRGG